MRPAMDGGKMMIDAISLLKQVNEGRRSVLACIVGQWRRSPLSINLGALGVRQNS